VKTNWFGFTISWATSIPVVVEACTSLANPIWSPVHTNTLTGGSSYFSDPEWANYPARFYRLRSPWGAGVAIGHLWAPQPELRTSRASTAKPHRCSRRKPCQTAETRRARRPAILSRNNSVRNGERARLACCQRRPAVGLAFPLTTHRLVLQPVERKFAAGRRKPHAGGMCSPLATAWTRLSNLEIRH
jgi:hypothetical protein